MGKQKKTKDGKSPMWSGRFDSAMDPDMQALSFSLHFDRQLYADDIKGSLVHAQGLLEAGMLTRSEFSSITAGLKAIHRDLDRGEPLFKPEDEDIHMAIERILTERIGKTGKKLHTGRSRNDQVATTFRLYIRRQTSEILSLIRALQESLFKKAAEYKLDIMPGYTHMQQAQPVYISHYLLSFFWALERDRQRFFQVLSTASELPLGSGALAGSAFPFDRKKAAERLGFSGITANSIDATAHRDYVLEFLSTAAILGSLLSRYAEDLVTWSSQEFGFISIHEAFTSGSSMMPQKKNPDSMELIRGKSGRLLGSFCSVFTAVKGAPMCYSRDLQEDKEPVFDAAATLKTCLKVMAKTAESLTFHLDTISQKLDPGMLATDLADLLAKNGVPFRDAHHLAGQLVKKSEQCGCPLNGLPDTFWKEIPGGLAIPSSLTFRNAVERRGIEGGTGQKSVENQLKKAGRLLAQSRRLDS